MRLILIFVLSFCAISFTATAQKAKREKMKKAERVDRSNAFEPDIPERAMAPAKTRKTNKKSFRARYKKSLDQKKKDFEKRMEANAKEDRKMRREMEKPQYSDPSYFGHKRKPKKRPPGKRKLCKECGIVH